MVPTDVHQQLLSLKTKTMPYEVEDSFYCGVEKPSYLVSLIISRTQERSLPPLQKLILIIFCEEYEESLSGFEVRTILVKHPLHGE